MKQFYKQLFDPGKQKRFFFRFFRAGKDRLAAWSEHHQKILKHAGLGGKSHVIEKGRGQWNRKGRW